MAPNRIWTLYLGLALSLIWIIIPLGDSRAANITVDSTRDVLDAAVDCSSVTLASLPGPDGVTSLREALCAANANPGADTIEFGIPAATDEGCDAGSGLCTMRPATAFPTLTDAFTTIDGYSQAGAAPASGGAPATILIQIDGSHVVDNNGLNITSAGNRVQGLAVNRFPWNGIAIGGSGAKGNTISGNYLGLDSGGTVDLGNGYDGIFLGLGAQDNLIGGDEPEERNVSSGNGWEGVGIHGSGTTGNSVSGNYIGVSADGLHALGNTLSGVRLYGGTQNNLIGGDTAGDRNLISGNQGNGVLVEGAETTGNVISANYIGTDVTGTAAVPNQAHGVEINLAVDNQVGGSTPGERNVISGNGDDGVLVSNQAGVGNLISGNYIGVDASGLSALPNANDGVTLLASEGNQVGGDTPGERNVISGNGDDGITIAVSYEPGNLISGNYIGVDASGLATLPNQDIGVNISTSSDNQIGGDTPGKGNVISGNGGEGISIRNPPSHDNLVIGNYIGLNATGTAALPNLSHGVLIDIGAHHNRVGGSAEGERNVISGNRGGVMIGGGDFTEVTSANSVLGNYIGLAADGLTAMGNDQDGVHISVNSPDNLIGPGNVIAYNGWDGVRVDTPLAVGNIITENSIFANADLGIDLSNGGNNFMPSANILVVPGGPGVISGAAFPGSTVEVFASRDGDGEGEAFLGSTTAGGAGDFDLVVSGLPYPYLTATATDADDGTSEFSAVFTGSVPVLHVASGKTVDRLTAAPGEMLAYTLTLSNTGTSVSSAALTDTLPAGVTWAGGASASSGTLTWENAQNRLLWSGAVPLDEPVLISFQVRVDEGVSAGDWISNVAVVDSGAGYVFELRAPDVTVVFHRLYLPVILRQFP